MLAPEHLSFEARLGNKNRRQQLCFAASAIRHHLFSVPQPPKWLVLLHFREDGTSVTNNCSKLLWSWREARSPLTDHTGGLQPHHAAVSGFLFPSRQRLFQASPRSGNLAVPSIYLGWEQPPKGQQSPAKRGYFCFTVGANGWGWARALQSLTTGEGDSVQGRPRLSELKIQLNGITVFSDLRGLIRFHMPKKS